MNLIRAVATATVLLGAAFASAQLNTPTARNMGIDQKLGVQVPMDATFTDEHGKPVRLGDVFSTRPVILMPIFYTCQGVCGIDSQMVVNCRKEITRAANMLNCIFSTLVRGTNKTTCLNTTPCPQV
mgnify:CR=1 FL=1